MGIPVNNRNLPYVLGVLCLIPLGGTLYRLTEIVMSGQWRFNFSPEAVDRLPLFIHALAMMAFLGLGVFQLSGRLRTKRPAVHRSLGRIAGMGAIIGGASGVWMTLMHLEISTPLLITGRLFFGSAMAVFTILAIQSAIQKDFASHRAWIIRAYAIGINAATLPFVYLPIFLIVGEPTPIVDDAIQVAGWMINLAIAERFIVGRKSFLKGASI
jgi:hypothetical protein